MANIAVAWLLEKDWPAWCALDDQLPPYARWPSKISTAIEDAERTGVKSEKIEIDPQIFLAWCGLTGSKGTSRVRCMPPKF